MALKLTSVCVIQRSRGLWADLQSLINVLAGVEGGMLYQQGGKQQPTQQAFFNRRDT